jgi:hypothetical protein
LFPKARPRSFVWHRSRKIVDVPANSLRHDYAKFDKTTEKRLLWIVSMSRAEGSRGSFLTGFPGFVGGSQPAKSGEISALGRCHGLRMKVVETTPVPNRKDERKTHGRLLETLHRIGLIRTEISPWILLSLVESI